MFTFFTYALLHATDEKESEKERLQRIYGTMEELEKQYGKLASHISFPPTHISLRKIKRKLTGFGWDAQNKWRKCLRNPESASKYKYFARFRPWLASSDGHLSFPSHSF